MPYSFRLVCGIFNVPQSLRTLKGCETGPTVSYFQDPECWWLGQSRTHDFQQPDAQPTEPPVRGLYSI